LRDLPDWRLTGRRLARALAACGPLLGFGCTLFAVPATEATFEPTSREVVAFVEPYDPVGDARTRDDYAAALAALRRGLSQLADCAGLPRSSVHLILVERVTVVCGDETHDFELPEVAGIVLMDAQRKPRWVDAGSNAAAIPGALAAHAAEYYGAPACGATSP
jgi:hypothetical protein